MNWSDITGASGTKPEMSVSKIYRARVSGKQCFMLEAMTQEHPSRCPKLARLETKGA
jgi:hypothetical protein